MAASHGGSTRAAAIRTFLIADIRGLHALHGPSRATRPPRALRRSSPRSPPKASRPGTATWSSCAATRRWRSSTRHARRCAQPSSCNRHSPTRLQADPSLPLEVGIGLDAGEAVPVGDGYRGAALNLASDCARSPAPARSSPARGSSILAGRLEGLDYEPLAATTLKGLDEPVTAVRVSGQEVPAPAVAGEPRSPAPGSPAPLPARARPDRAARWPRDRAALAELALAPRAPRSRARAGAVRAARDRQDPPGGRAGDQGATTLGATVVYSPATPRHWTPRAWTTSSGSTGPRLVIVDDLDAAPAR